MRLFYLRRLIDISGVSGIGRVAEGVVFDDGTVALRWLSSHRSVEVWPTLGDMIAIHGHGGKSVVEMIPTSTSDGPISVEEAEMEVKRIWGRVADGA